MTVQWILANSYIFEATFYEAPSSPNFYITPHVRRNFCTGGVSGSHIIENIRDNRGTIAGYKMVPKAGCKMGSCNMFIQFQRIFNRYTQAIGGVWLQSTVLTNSSLQATGFKKLSLQTTFWLSRGYKQKLGTILQSTGFENAQLRSTKKSIAPPSHSEGRFSFFSHEWQNGM